MEPLEPTKRELRQQKREIKRAGGKRRRRQLKQALAENPEEAPYAEVDFGRYESAKLNGIDHDATRRTSHPRSAEGARGTPFAEDEDVNEGSGRS